MDSIFLELNIFISGWITAFILAVLSVYFIIRTDFFHSIVNRLERTSPNEFILHNSRLLLAGSMMVLLGLFLAILMSLEPDQDGMLISIIRNRVPVDVWRQYYFYLDDLLITLGVFFLLAFIPTINRIFTSLCKKINRFRDTRFRVIRIQSLEIFTPNQMVGVLILTIKYIRLAIIVAVFLVCMTLVFGLYPQTDGMAQTVLIILNEALSALWEQILSFLPNLIALIIIIAITRMVLKLLRFFYNGLQKGKIIFSSIHPEVVEPTYQLLRFLVMAFALVAAFPYIPGSSSPMFKGLSIFVGFLISLGSTSIVTNVISGIVLTYSRGLKIGDRVQIGDTVGDVIDRTLLIIRVKTIKNEVITIPNVVVMQNQIVNFSAEAQREGLILHTSITIGYDEPWRHVQKLLIKAALDTTDIVETPEPFVLKTSLDDHYVTYELNAYTDNPVRMADIYSDLHQNILDKFSQASVEIMSPTYFAFRDGQDSTIPQIDIPKNGNGDGSRKINQRSTFNPYREKTQPLGSR